MAVGQYKGLRFIGGWSNATWDFADMATGRLISVKTMVRKSLEALKSEISRQIRRHAIAALQKGYELFDRVLEIRLSPEQFRQLSQAEIDELVKEGLSRGVDVIIRPYP